RLLVDQLRAKIVDHADGARAIRIKQRRIIFDDRQVFIDEQTLIDDVDLKLARAQPPASKLQLFGRTHARRIALALEVFAEQFKLFLRRQVFEINDGDLRCALRLMAEKLCVRPQQDFEQQV